MSHEHEPERRELTPELAALEGRLAGLSLTALRVDRDKLMFAAGRAAALAERPTYIAEPSRLGTKFWPTATALATAASVALATMLILERRVDQQTVSVPSPPRAVEAQPELTKPSPQPEFAWKPWQSSEQPTTGYLGIRQVALTRGINAIDSTFSATSSSRDPGENSSASQRQILDELLPSNRIELLPRS